MLDEDEDDVPEDHPEPILPEMIRRPADNPDAEFDLPIDNLPWDDFILMPDRS